MKRKILKKGYLKIWSDFQHKIKNEIFILRFTFDDKIKIEKNKPQLHFVLQYNPNFHGSEKSFPGFVAIDHDTLRMGVMMRDRSRPLIALLIGRGGDNPQLNQSLINWSAFQ